MPERIETSESVSNKQIGKVKNVPLSTFLTPGTDNLSVSGNQPLGDYRNIMGNARGFDQLLVRFFLHNVM